MSRFLNYELLKGDKKSLRAGFSQFDISTIGYGSSQCCAIAAYGIATASLIDPSEWNQSQLHRILRKGNELYCQLHDDFKNQGQQNHSSMLAVDELVNVELKVKKDINYHWVTLQMERFDLQPQLEGVLNSCIMEGKNEQNSLANCIQRFISSNHPFAIMVSSGYCFALVHLKNWCYLLDSHSRDSEGMIKDTGTAVIIACRQATAAKEIARILNNNLDTFRKVNEDDFCIDKNNQEHLKYEIAARTCFQIIPVSANIIGEQDSVQGNNHHFNKIQIEFQTYSLFICDHRPKNYNKNISNHFGIR